RRWGWRRRKWRLRGTRRRRQRWNKAGNFGHAGQWWQGDKWRRLVFHTNRPHVGHDRRIASRIDRQPQFVNAIGYFSRIPHGQLVVLHRRIARQRYREPQFIIFGQCQIGIVGPVFNVVVRQAGQIDRATNRKLPANYVNRRRPTDIGIRVQILTNRGNKRRYGGFRLALSERRRGCQGQRNQDQKEGLRFRHWLCPLLLLRTCVTRYQDEST